MRKKIITDTINIEGGYVNNPDDKGGETKYGISKRQFPNENIKELTKQRAHDLYVKHYWNDAQLDSFPEEYQDIYFDMVVNHGKYGAARILQRAINSKAGKRGTKLRVDGRVGSKTFAALRKYRPERDRVLAYRAKYFADILRRTPTQDTFFFGWIRERVFKFI